MEGIISNIQRCSLHDGPGVRTTVFLKGCPLRCQWCHNPETYCFGPELRYDREQCICCGSCADSCSHAALQIGEQGLVYLKSSCVHCFECANACPSGALSVAGTRMTVDQVLREVLQDRGLYLSTGGGVTLSGGEATAQPEFLSALMEALHAEGIHIALDTSGYCSPDIFRRLASGADLVLYDLKHMDPETHRHLTGVDNGLILRNLLMLEQMGIPVEIRIPFIPGKNDDPENLSATADFLKPLRCVSRAILLGYHPLGQTKIYNFAHHGRDLGISVPSRAVLERAAAEMQNRSGKEILYR